MYHRELMYTLTNPKHIPDFSNKVACKITEYGVHGYTWKIKQMCVLHLFRKTGTNKMIQHNILFRCDICVHIWMYFQVLWTTQLPHV